MAESPEDMLRSYHLQIKELNKAWQFTVDKGKSGLVEAGFRDLLTSELIGYLVFKSSVTLSHLWFVTRKDKI